MINHQLQKNLDNLNEKCLQLNSSLGVLQSKKSLSGTVTTVFTNNTSNLDVTNILFCMGAVFVVVLIASCAYSFCVDNTFLETVAGKAFINKN